MPAFDQSITAFVVAVFAIFGFALAYTSWRESSDREKH